MRPGHRHRLLDLRRQRVQRKRQDLQPQGKLRATKPLTGQHRRGHVGAGRCLRGDVHTEITCDKNRSFPDLDSYGKERAYQEDGQGPVDEQGLRKATFTVSGTEV